MIIDWSTKHQAYYSGIFNWTGLFFRREWGSKTFSTFTGRDMSDFSGKDFSSDSVTYMRKVK